MKASRHELIRKIIRENEVDTQDLLIEKLAEEGIEVTQATISRDIRQLKLVKTLDSNGKYRYSIPTDSKTNSSIAGSYIHGIVGVTVAENIVVIKTNTGLAQAVAYELDSGIIEGFLGCVAGDDTIIAVATDKKAAENISAKLNIKG